MIVNTASAMNYNMKQNKNNYTNNLVNTATINLNLKEWDNISTNQEHVAKESKLGEGFRYLFQKDTYLYGGLSYSVTKQVEFINMQLQINCLIQFLFSIISMLNATVSYEMEYNQAFSIIF